VVTFNKNDNRNTGVWGEGEIHEKGEKDRGEDRESELEKGPSSACLFFLSLSLSHSLSLSLSLLQRASAL